jgi:hypothetical protein
MSRVVPSPRPAMPKQLASEPRHAIIISPILASPRARNEPAAAAAAQHMTCFRVTHNHMLGAVEDTPALATSSHPASSFPHSCTTTRAPPPLLPQTQTRTQATSPDGSVRVLRSPCLITTLPVPPTPVTRQPFPSHPLLAPRVQIKIRSVLVVPPPLPPPPAPPASRRAFRTPPVVRWARAWRWPRRQRSQGVTRVQPFYCVSEPPPSGAEVACGTQQAPHLSRRTLG